MIEFADASRKSGKSQALSAQAASLGRDDPVHANVLQQLSKETGWRVDEIEALYKRIMSELAASSSVHDYLFILVPKRIKRIVGRSRHSA